MPLATINLTGTKEVVVTSEIVVSTKGIATIVTNKEVTNRVI